MTPAKIMLAAPTLVAASLAGAAGQAATKAREDKTMAAMLAVYDLAKSERLLNGKLASDGDELERYHGDRPVAWRRRNTQILLEIPYVRKQPGPTKRPEVKRWGLHFQIGLINRAALGARSTRVTLAWSGAKDVWSEQQVCLLVNGTWRLQTARAAASSFAGRRLAIEVPARDVRRYGGLDVAIYIANRAPPGEHPLQVYADALELELLP